MEEEQDDDDDADDDDDDDDLRTRRRSIFFGTYMCVYIYKEIITGITISLRLYHLSIYILYSNC